ncbi:hypothetical protein PybrP1_012467 [[Pythium] brassicae (nom. inval.)]|nr:hypothetical protein PybrP1_012467 [[Pythium] brassicae (nom. inval.)]
MDFQRLVREERARRKQEKAAASDPPAPPQSSAAANSTSQDAITTTPLRVWTKRSELEREPFAVGGIAGVYYVPEWLSEDEEQAILERVYAVPDDNSVWVKLKHRRLQMWGGDVKAPFRAEPLPAWLLQIVQALVDAKVFCEAQRPNHALINEYGVGEGILPHEDGPSYFPLVAIVSTGAESTVTFEPHRRWLESASKNSDGAAGDENALSSGRRSFRLARRSLLLFTGDAYTKYLHSIDGVEAGKRVSLTIRHVSL